MDHKLLRQLLNSAGPSGYEKRPSKVWRKAAKFADKVSFDTMGSSFAQVGTGNAFCGLVGHIDEIGLIVSSINSGGFLHIKGVGGWDPQNLIGQRVLVMGKKDIVGVIGRKAIHLLSVEERKRAVKMEDLTIDIGAANREEAEEHVTIGDVAVIDCQPQEMLGGRLASRSMDNRLGSYVVLEALRLASQKDYAPKLQVPVMAVAAVQEEIGLKGAGTSAYSNDWKCAVAVDVCHATDVPGTSTKDLGEHPLGSGPVITLGPTIHPKVSKMLIKAAKQQDIPYTLMTSTRGTSTDADSIATSRGGVPVGLVSIPLRYMHSSIETCQLTDVENTIKLLARFVANLKPEQDFKC